MRTITIAPLDLSGISALSATDRARVGLLYDACKAVAGAEHGTRGAVMAAQADLTGLSVKSLQRIYAAWRESGGNWQALCDGRRVGAHKSAAIPAAFAAHVAALHERHQRDTSGKQVWRVLIDAWKRWQVSQSPTDAIPGYDAPPPPTAKGYPAGWSAKNINRMRGTSYGLKLARQGSKAASALLPSVLTSRVGLQFFQRVFFDDQEYDTKVVIPGLSGPMRPVGFNALDHYSGAFVDYCLKLKREDGDTVRSLNKEDFTWFVVRLLCTVGYRDDATGTELIFEHGTADAYRSKSLTSGTGHTSFEDAIAAVTGERVRISRSGRFGDPVFAGMLFRGKSTGNFRFKSPIESMFNLVRNHAAALPGAQGRNFALSPEEMPGMEAEEKQLLSVWQSLSDDRRALIPHFHHLTFAEFGWLFRDIYRAINGRRDHALEGWEKLNHVRSEWSLDGDMWLPRERLLALPPAKQELAATVADWRAVRMSPAEVVAQHKGELTRLHWSNIPLVMPLQWARAMKVSPKYTVQIKDSLIDPEPLVYIAQAETAQGRTETLSPGDEILGYLNPFDPSFMVICDKAGRLIGRLTQHVRATAGTAEVYPQIHRIEQLRKTLSIGTELGAATLMEERQALVDLRRDLQNGAPVSASERADAAAIASRDKRMDRAIQAPDWDEFDAPQGAAPSPYADDEDTSFLSDL